jgi:hypothetical protein
LFTSDPDVASNILALEIFFLLVEVRSASNMLELPIMAGKQKNLVTIKMVTRQKYSGDNGIIEIQLWYG